MFLNNTKKKLPWISREIKTLIRKRNKLFKRMKLHNSTKLVDAYKNIKQAIQKETRKAYWTYMENIICHDENLNVTQKQKQLWNYSKNTRKDNTGISPLIKDGILIDDTTQKEEILNEQYHSVFTVDDIGEKIRTLYDNYPNMPHINIKTEGVEKSGSFKSN